MNEESWFGLYRLFRAIGMPKVTVPVEVKKGSRTYTLPVGWPELKIAITLDGSEGKKFKQEGWQVVHIPANALAAAEPVIRLLDELARKRTVADSFAQAEMTVSKTENKLLDALLKAGLSEPDRNFKFLDQHRNTITIPDFVWEDPKVAVFVDGEFFHGLRDLGDSLQAILTADPGLKSEFTEQSKDTMAKDAAKRRKLTKAGWKVIVVTASEIDTGELDGIVNDILTAVRQAPRYVPPEDSGEELEEEKGWILDIDDEDSDDPNDPAPSPPKKAPESKKADRKADTQELKTPETSGPSGKKYDLPPPEEEYELEEYELEFEEGPEEDVEEFEEEFEEEVGEDVEEEVLGSVDPPQKAEPSWLKKEHIQKPEGKAYNFPPPGQ